MSSPSIGVLISGRGSNLQAIIDAVAGGETAGIPFAAFLAALAKKPMVYVRKQPKGFGRMAQIEGELKPGKRVLLVEDLATDGGSKLVFIEALKKAEAKVTDCFVIFHYGIFPQSVEMLAAAGVTTVSAHARPRVTIFSTGDEVVPPETATLRPGQVRDATAVALAAMAAEAGGEPATQPG